MNIVTYNQKISGEKDEKESMIWQHGQQNFGVL